MTMDSQHKNSYHGHRSRLRKRFLDELTSKKTSHLADYELLELLLFSAFPRKDVKPLAKDLIAYFGSFSAVLSASPKRLKEVDGMGDVATSVIKTAYASALMMLKEEHHKLPVLSNWQSLNDYLRVSMQHLKTTEQFRVLFLNAKNELIADEIQQEGTINATPIYTREIVHRALDLGSTAIILVHNHPSGSPSPSQNDIDVTQKIKMAAENLSITLHDHVIVGRNENLSMKSMGYI